MTFMNTAHTTLTGIGFAIAASALSAPATAQVTAPMGESEISALPAEYQSGPVVKENEDVVVGPDGIETITRTRRIEATPPQAGTAVRPAHGYGGPQDAAHSRMYGYAPGVAVFQRDQWIEECERRTNNRGDREKGGIIGSLLGAITGGIIGNRVADGERLGGTLIGAGVGGLGGLLLGQLIGGGRNDRGEYDCEAALDSYLSQYGQPGMVHGAHRVIHAPVHPSPGYHGYAYRPAHYGHQYSYAPPQQVVYVPIHYQQQQRVVVRETVREEVIPGSVRSVPEPQPAPRPVPPRYIKGN